MAEAFTLNILMLFWVVSQCIAIDTIFKLAYMPFVVFSDKTTKDCDVSYRANKALCKSNSFLFVELLVSLIVLSFLSQYQEPMLMLSIIAIVKMAMITVSVGCSIKNTNNVLGINHRKCSITNKVQLEHFISSMYTRAEGSDIHLKYTLGQVRFTHLLIGLTLGVLETIFVFNIHVS